MNENINLWFAKDENNKIITIDKANKNNKYTCPICGGEVIPKALTSEMISPHFAHIDRESCEGESIIHWWTKNNLLKSGDVFSVFTNEEKQYLCKNIILEKEYDTPYGKYKPDVTIECYNGEIIFLEVGFTNIKKKVNYIDRWTYLNKPVIEFNIRNIYDVDSLEIKLNNRFQAVYYDGVKIYKNDKSYESFKKKIESFEKYKQQIEDLGWFIDDIYEYRITKNEDKLDGIIKEIKYIEESYTYEHSRLVEDILKTKCNSTMKSIVKRKDLYLNKNIDDFLSKLNCKYTYELEKFENERLIWDKLYGNIRCNIKIIFDNDTNLNDEDISKAIWDINIKHSDFPKIFCDKENNICISKEFYISKKEDLIPIQEYFDESIIENLKEVINKNLNVYENYKNGLYAVQDEYILSCENVLIENLKNTCRNILGYNSSNRFPYMYEFLKVDELVQGYMSNSNFVATNIDGIEYIDSNQIENKAIINSMESELNFKIEYIIEKNKKCKEIDSIFDGEIETVFKNGYTFKFNKKLIYIDSEGLIYYEELPILNLGVDFEDDIQSSIKVLKDFLKNSGNISIYTKEQIVILNKLKDIYNNKTFRKFNISLERSNFMLRDGYEIIAQTPINAKWKEINKTLSDKVRKYLYN